MLHKLKINSRSNKASVLVELVLVVPLILLVLGGIFELGRMYYIQTTLEYSAKEAARIGASIRESVDGNYMSKGTVSRNEIENLIVNGIRVNNVIEEPGQFMIRYLNITGNEVASMPDLPFDRQNNPGAVNFIEVEITYPGQGESVSSPIPVVFNPGNIFQNSLQLMAKAVFQIEGRFER